MSLSAFFIELLHAGSKVASDNCQYQVLAINWLTDLTVSSGKSMKHQFVILGLLSFWFATSVQAEVYLCIDKAGHREYTNVDNKKGCKRVALPGVTMIPAPKGTAQAVSTRPADFPRVTDEAQKRRDDERKQILLDEMNKEQKKLSDLRAEYKGGEPERRGDERNYAKYQERTATLKEDVERSEKNVAALKRELDNLK